MDSVHIVIIILGIAFFYFGSTFGKSYLENRRTIRESELKSDNDKKLIEQQKFASEEETKRVQIIADLAKKDYRIDNLERSAHDLHTSLVKSLSNTENAIINGVSIDGETAKILTQNTRRKSADVRIDGRFIVRGIDSQEVGKYRVSVRNQDSSEDISASVQDDSLSGNFKRLLQESLWGREPVEIKINAKLIGEEIKSAVIVDVQPIKSDSEKIT